ncbi:MAG TPA: tRNA (N6-isopentenyl adenosine(37)-C2)-methylthiotransferase MiaB [Bacteroidales bacterium]|nr:tRNA (N6-isopentenyl adenosine(37)-C2)-methylthiotransferase MiaB [Bacteroidales bacterium]
MKKQLFFLETYGCQMNFSDSEIIASVMNDKGFEQTDQINQADIIFVNTCSIRENAEQRVRKRLKEFNAIKKKNPKLMVGLLGCMAERLKDQLLNEEKLVDIIAGPDSYRDIPKLIHIAESGQKAINVLLSAEETYADISPVRLDKNGIAAFISIMRGCENFCSYCIVPYTRGKERSRSPQTIINEATDLFNKGYREITLLGQNVNSYLWNTENQKVDFPDLINQIAQINPKLRIRFATSHPKDLSDRLIEVIKKHLNIARAVHLPVQSGSTEMLKRMNRKYTREMYMERIQALRKNIPDISISTDIICGFSSETDQDHADTISLMEWVTFDYAFMFKYSERPNTTAYKKYPDNVPEEVKSKRLTEIINIQQKLSLLSNKKDIGKIFEVLIEGDSRRSKDFLSGRNSQNKVVIFPKKAFEKGTYVNVLVNRCSTATLFGEVIEDLK